MRLLLVNHAIVFDPSRLVTLARVAVGPVNQPACVVPFILAFKRNNVAFAKPDDSWRQVNVVCDKKRLPRRESHHEALMPAAVVVVRKHTANEALPFHLQVTCVLLESAGEYLVAG